jgi:ABC-2 type transport system ATP-binding protein
MAMATGETGMSEHALVIDGLSAGYPGRQVLSTIDLCIERGEWLALVGPNGSGKSTLLDCIAGRMKIQAGAIRIAGFALDSSEQSAKRQLGYAIAPEKLPPLLSGRQCLAVHAAAKQITHDDSELEQLADELGIAKWLDDAVAMYSYGTRQKLGVLLALIGEPALIVLDESFNGLDPASGLALKRRLRARVDAGRCAILLATHALDIVERYTDRAVLLHEGRFIGNWNRRELAAFRDSHDGGLEAALAQAMHSA